jgi:hypothetical protein
LEFGLNGVKTRRALTRSAIIIRNFQTSLLLQGGAGSYYDLSSCFDLTRVFLSSSGEFLVGLASIQLGDDIVDGLVNVKLFATEDVDESRASVRECMNADVALSDYDESADSPFGRIVAGPIDECVGRSDLVHPDNVGKFI